MAAARRTEPPGLTRATSAARTTTPAAARHRLGSTPSPLMISPRTIATCWPETAVRWVMDTTRMSERTSAGRAWSSPRATPLTSSRAPSGQCHRPDAVVGAPTTSASPARRDPTVPSTPSAGASSRTAASDPRTTARASPASPGRGVARTRTTAPMGRSYQSSLPRTRALRREALPSTSVTARSVSTTVRRGPATTRGSVCTVPRSVTVRPSAAARVRGSPARLHEPAADTASTAAIASTASRMLAITDPRADPSGASAPGRGS